MTQPQASNVRCALNLRQGCIIAAEDIRHLKLGVPENHNLYIVISHDCDIANTPEKEPFIEVMSCFIHEGGASETYGKNVRLLHLPINHNRQTAHLTLEPHHKKNIKKEDLQNISFCENFSLEQSDLKLLQTWLAARYRRHAFPESLAHRLNKVEQEINKFGKKPESSGGIIAIFLKIDPENEELDEDGSYEIRFRVVYEADHLCGQANAQALAEIIEKAVEKANKSNANIHAPEIKAMSDTEFTLKDSRSWLHWRFEHLSFRGEQIGSMIEP